MSTRAGGASYLEPSCCRRIPFVFAAEAGRLGRLGVGDARARERIPTQATPQQLAQGGVESLEGAIDAPLLPEPVVDVVPRCSKSFGSSLPRAAGL